MGKPRERQLIRDYIADRYPNSNVIFNCPLGPVPELLVATWGARKALRVGRGLRPEVDALVIEPGMLHLIEAKIIKWVDGISKLPVYRALVPTTPELEPYRDYKIHLILCTPWANEPIVEAAKRLWVDIDIFTTPEVDEYVGEMGKYWTGDYRKAREERNRARSLLGLE